MSAVACGHSACVQNHIDTGETACIRDPGEVRLETLTELLDAASYIEFAMRDGAVFARDHAAKRLFAARRAVDALPDPIAELRKAVEDRKHAEREIARIGSYRGRPTPGMRDDSRRWGEVYHACTATIRRILGTDKV